MTKIGKNIDIVADLEKKLHIKKLNLIDKAMRSDDPSDILKAQTYVSNLIQEREQSDRKSFLIDPLEFATSIGYKDKATGISYDTLSRMALTPIINAIIKTRINQVASFAEPQRDKYSVGFKIFKKGNQHGAKMSKAEEKRALEIEDFLLNCGRNNSWEGDDFDTFIRKITHDSLVYDQMTFEIIRDRKGIPIEFLATDASTFRIADSIDDDTYKQANKKQIKGYYPSYVQIDNDQIVAEFYPWELCFGIRNASTSVYNYGYGISELEELIQTITAILWSEEYNRRFFSQGSAPKGIIKVDSSVSPAKLQEFKQQWQAMISGVYNSWKTPIMEAGKVDFVNLQQSNRDMEYGQWMEYLIKIACSIYTIDPAEINFPINGSSNASTVFESNNESKLTHSKDKGLYPLLKFIQKRINKYLVSQLDPDYYFQFVGMDAVSKTEELDMAIKKIDSFATLNEIREEMGYKALKDETADEVLNPNYLQAKGQAQQAEMAEKMQQQPGMGQPGAPGAPNGGDEEDEDNPNNFNFSEAENPFGKK